MAIGTNAFKPSSQKNGKENTSRKDAAGEDRWVCCSTRSDRYDQNGVAKMPMNDAMITPRSITLRG